MVQSGLCLVGLRDVLGSSFLDLQSQVFSELHDSHPCTRLVCWASVRKIHRSLALLFSFLGSTLWLCAQRSSLLGALQSQVHTLLVSTLRSLALLHCLQLFPMVLPALRCDTSFCFAGPPAFPLGLRSFLVDLVPRQLSLRGSPGSTLRFQPVSFSQFVTLSVLSWM